MWSSSDLLLTLVEDEGSGMVVSRHGHHHISVEGPPAVLVYSVPRDGGGGVTGPVQRVPGSVIRQTFHWSHICKEKPHFLLQANIRNKKKWEQ